VVIVTATLFRGDECLDLQGGVIKNRDGSYTFCQLDAWGVDGKLTLLSQDEEKQAEHALALAADRKEFCFNCYEHSAADCAYFGCPAPPDEGDDRARGEDD
jgi:hypothetical protein